MPYVWSRRTDSGPFIDFMLNEILEALKKYQGEPLMTKVPDKLKTLHPEFSDVTWEVLAHIKGNPHITAIGIGRRMGILDRMVRKHIALLRNAGIIHRRGSNKNGCWETLDAKCDRESDS